MTPSHHDPDTLAATALDLARRHGCTCSAEVDLTEQLGGIWMAEVIHAQRCALLARRTAAWN